MQREDGRLPCDNWQLVWLPNWICAAASGAAGTSSRRLATNPATEPGFRPVGAENRATLCDLQVLVDEAAEPVSPEHADGRTGS